MQQVVVRSMSQMHEDLKLQNALIIPIVRVLLIAFFEYLTLEVDNWGCMSNLIIDLVIYIWWPS
jgi:hypothetical protein